MNNQATLFIIAFAICAVLSSCHQEESIEPAPNFITITIKEASSGDSLPVANAEVELSVSETYTGYRAARNPVVKRTDKDGRAYFPVAEIRRFIQTSESGILYIWAHKEGTYLSNHAIGPKPIMYNEHINSAHQLILENSVTEALISANQWNLVRLTINGSPEKYMPSCLEDNYVQFHLNEATGMLDMHMYEGLESCSDPVHTWDNSTQRIVNGDNRLILTGKPLLWKGFLDKFESIHRENQDGSLTLEDLSVQVFHPDSITISTVSKYFKQGSQSDVENVVYYCYRMP